MRLLKRSKISVNKIRNEDIYSSIARVDTLPDGELAPTCYNCNTPYREGDAPRNPTLNIPATSGRSRANSRWIDTLTN